MMTEQQLKQAVAEELQHNILPFWSEHVIDPQGGFCGRITGTGLRCPDAERSAILGGRLLWTFSAAGRVLRDPQALRTAEALRRYFTEHFIDRTCGGVYWSLHADGTPADRKKQFYAIAFAIYGLSEYARATGDAAALQEAVALYRTIEEHAFDAAGCGYEEAAACDWGPLDDVRLSDKDDNEKRTMNTHLHILEAYTNLYRVWPDATLREQLCRLIRIFLTRIVRPDGHLGLFFDEQWQLKSGACSYGHDIEASWLLREAAAVAGDAALLAETEAACLRIGDAGLEGLLDDGSMIYERHADGRLDTERHWWVQAECVVGLLYRYRFHGRPEAFAQAVRCWEYIRERLVDRAAGEWHWSILPDGSVNRAGDKAGFWKCPYHNGRMCLELIEMLA